MFLRRLFDSASADPAEADPVVAPATGPDRAAGAAGETETVRRIVASLEAMPSDEARYLAGFAYLLSRAAAADLDISALETETMERIVVEHGGLSEAQAVIVVEIAKTQARLHGGTEDYLVTREFTRLATEEQRRAALRCGFIISAADAWISAEENAVLAEIANELGLAAADLAAIRAEFADRLGALQGMRAALGVTTPSG